MTTDWRFQFGPFTLSPAERLLEHDGIPVKLGGRALELLIVLVQSAGEIIGKRELLARVWPNLVVEEGNLRFHIVALRKALGDNGNDHRYIINIANKGYSFIAPVQKTSIASHGDAAKPDAGTRLPALATAVLGRSEEISALATALSKYRLVSIVGSGGIGKTTVATAAMHALYREFAGDVHFVDFSCITARELIRATVAGAMGVAHSVEDQRALEAHLAERKSLIVLDCCEHLIEEIAMFVERILRNCPNIRFLITSREVLKAIGEYVYRLQPLAFPPPGAGLTKQEALAYPAVALFVERAAAGGFVFSLTDDDAPLVSRVCRELDGIALAIELAASRIDALGLHAVTRHLGAGAALSWPGRRTATARHQTLRATLDWSFNLLQEEEQKLLRRLSVFAGTFSLNAGLAICCHDTDQFVAMDRIAGLVAKSLVAVDAGGTSLRYRLLDTTRSYCREMLQYRNEYNDILRRQALFYHDWLMLVTNRDEVFTTLGQELPNLRAALDWHIADRNNHEMAVELAAIACPLLWRASQLIECSRWAEAALAVLPGHFLGSHLEMRLQGALGQSLMFLGHERGGSAAAAYDRSIALAEQLGDLPEMLHVLNGYLVLLHRQGSYTAALAIASKARLLLTALDDSQSRFAVDSLMGVCLHLVGRVGEAQRHWESCFTGTCGAPQVPDSYASFEYHIRALCGMSRTFWLTGKQTQAYALAEETIQKARARGHAVTYCIALIWAGSVYSFAQDMERIDGVARELERIGKLHSLEPYRNVAEVLQGQVLILQGQSAAGLERIRKAVESLHGHGYRMITSVALTWMAQALSDLSLHAASLSMCNEAEAMIRHGGDMLRLPPLLVTRGRSQWKIGAISDAENSFSAAIEVAADQGAWTEQLRATLALADLYMAQLRNDEIAPLLFPFVSAPETDMPDIARARKLLDEATKTAKLA
jgi:predicted ATPase/DNA-binding winged helix-turn-helix (wHTH) protein